MVINGMLNLLLNKSILLIISYYFQKYFSFVSHYNLDLYIKSIYKI